MDTLEVLVIVGSIGVVIGTWLSVYKYWDYLKAEKEDHVD